MILITFFWDNGVAAAKVPINDISWFVESFAPNLDNQQLVADQMLSEYPAELYHEDRTAVRKRIFKNWSWTFRIGIESGENLLYWISVRIMESDKFD